MKIICSPVPEFVLLKFPCAPLLLSAICVILGQLVDHSKKQVIELGYVAAEAVMKARSGFPVGFGIVYMVWKVLVADRVPLVLRFVSVVRVVPTLVAPIVRVLKLPVPEQVNVAHVVSPDPFTRNGEEVPLKTWKPAPVVAITPDDVASEPVEIDVQLRLLEVKYPKVPVFPQDRLCVVVLPEESTLKTEPRVNPEPAI